MLGNEQSVCSDEGNMNSLWERYRISSRAKLKHLEFLRGFRASENAKKGKTYHHKIPFIIFVKPKFVVFEYNNRSSFRLLFTYFIFCTSFVSHGTYIQNVYVIQTFKFKYYRLTTLIKCGIPLFY